MTRHPQQAPRLCRSSSSLLAVLAFCGCPAIDAAAAPPDQGTLATVAQPTRLAPGDAVIGALPMKQPMHVVVGMKLRDRAGLDALIENNTTLQMAGRRPHLLTHQQVVDAYGPSAQQAQAVADYLREHGFANVAIAPDRLLVSADGTAANARDAFNTNFEQVRTRAGRIAFAHTDPVRIPASLQGSILAVLGLQSEAVPSTAVRAPAHAMASTEAVTAHNPMEFSAIYGGAGAAPASTVTVGLVIFSGTVTGIINDLASFTTKQGLPIVDTLVDQNGSSGGEKNAALEDAQSQTLVAAAGGLVKQFIFYIPPGGAYGDLFAIDSAVAANAAQVILLPPPFCELTPPDTYITEEDQALAMGVAQGQTFVSPNGGWDFEVYGADECQNGTNTPAYPASSPYVVAVGGTSLDATTTTWNSETAWLDSGGSESTIEPKPSWQTLWSGSHRAAIDVAFDADPNSGAQVIVNGAQTTQSGIDVSAAIFAGFWARILQDKGTDYGFAGPVIYSLPRTAFHDIKAGNNSGGESGIGYTAVPGYDLASGRGSLQLESAIAALGGTLPPVASFSFSSTSLTANFTDTSTDAGTIVSHAWTFGDGATSTAADPSHTFLLKGTYPVTDTVTDNLGATGSKTHSVIVMEPPGATQSLVNPGFERGVATPWAMTSGVLQNSASLAHSGSWYAELGAGYPGRLNDTVSQLVAIPSGRTNAALGFYLHTTTAETTGAHDHLTVEVDNSAGTKLATLATYSNLDASSGYVLKGFDMTPYIGQTVRIKFTGINTSSLPTTWALDDVMLETTP